MLWLSLVQFCWITLVENIYTNICNIKNSLEMVLSLEELKVTNAYECMNTIANWLQTDREVIAWTCALRIFYVNQETLWTALSIPYSKHFNVRQIRPKMSTIIYTVTWDGREMKGVADRRGHWHESLPFSSLTYSCWDISFATNIDANQARGQHDSNTQKYS